jgi:undecaprenyl diphosphate synthase
MPTSKENSIEHIAIIMDGNSRWAKKAGVTQIMGHKKGAEAARNILRPVADAGVKYLTLYTFSSENWNRPEDEVKNLMKLLKYYLGNELATLHENNIRLKIIGDRSRLKADIIKKIVQAEELTANNTSLTLILALSYGSRQEIFEAAKNMALSAINRHGVEKAVNALKKLEPVDFAEYLSTNGIPDPDLLIRTGGDHRISNFLLWQMAYTELYFTDTLWPDFDKTALQQAISSFSSRERRFGKR